MSAPRAQAPPTLAAEAAEVPAPAIDIEQIVAPVESAAVTMSSGRRYEIDAAPDVDRLVIRGRGGQVVLRIEVTDRGPVLSFSGADVLLAATRKLTLEAEELSLRASGDASITVAGTLRERVAGDHHTRVGGEEQLEAARVLVQSNRDNVELLAAKAVALDGEHIGLNDKRVPAPFPWSAAADVDEPSGLNRG